MTRVRFPSWWLAVGPDLAVRLEDLFAQVIKDLPMPQAELAEKLQVDQSTVARWAKGKSPPVETMAKAMEEVWEYLQPRFRRAEVAREAFQHLAAATVAEDADGFGAGKDEVAQLKKALAKLDE